MIELSELQAVDFALGGFIAGAFSRYNPDAGASEWKEFLSRATNRKIYRTNFDEPVSFINKLLSAEKTSTDQGGTKKNAPELPLVAYSRKPGLTNDDRAPEMLMPSFSGYNSQETNRYIFEVLPCTLAYTLMFMSWDTPSLDKLLVAWYAYVKGHYTFEVKYKIGEDLFPVKASLPDHKTLAFADSSAPIGERRLFAVESEIRIAVNVVAGKASETAVSVVDIDFNLVGYCGMEEGCCE